MATIKGTSVRKWPKNLDWGLKPEAMLILRGDGLEWAPTAAGLGNSH